MSQQYSYSSMLPDHHHLQDQQKQLGGFYNSYQQYSTTPVQSSSSLAQSWRAYNSQQEHQNQQHHQYQQTQQQQQHYIPRPSSSNYSHYSPSSNNQNSQQLFNHKGESVLNSTLNDYQSHLTDQERGIEDQKPYILPQSPANFSPTNSNNSNLSPISNSSTLILPPPPITQTSLSPLVTHRSPQTLGDLLNFTTAGNDNYDRNHYERPRLLSRQPGGLNEEGALFGCLPFILKLRGLLADEDSYSDVLRWDTSGTLFIIHHTAERLKTTILPDTYGHGNYPSFTRQLNIYGFRRLTAAQLNPLLDLQEEHTSTIIDYHGWVHISFLRDNPSLSIEMKPRTSFARRALKEEKERRLRAVLSRNAAGGLAKRGEYSDF